MDNIRLFDTELSFTRKKNSFVYPTVAYIRETDRLYYEPNPKNVVGSVYLHGPYGNVFAKIENIKRYSPELGYIPIGVVVVPAFHMEDNKCRVMSLKGMNVDSPDTGSSEHSKLCYGGYGTNVSELINYNVVCHVGSEGTVNETIQGTYQNAFLPSDKYNKVINPYDTDTYYSTNTASEYYAPSPFLTDGNFNPNYSSTNSPSSAYNALSDFDGENNTKILVGLATSQSDWKTAATIVNESGAGYYPAACCCWRFHTEGTSQGDWYLPALGELGYVIPNLNKINNVIQALIDEYGEGFSMQLTDTYHSSTEFGANSSRGITTVSGKLFINDKSQINSHARAFLKV